MAFSRVLSRVSPQMTNAIMRRSFNYGPPLVRISLKEKIGLFSVAMVIITGPMFYIMGNLKKFQGKA